MAEEIPRAQPPPDVPARRLRRWRRPENPLRRPTDLVRTWTGLILAVVVVATTPVTVLAVGQATSRAYQSTAHQQSLTRHRTTAVLVHDAPHHLEPGSDEADHARYPAEVRFTDAGGTTRTAVADVPPGLPAGATATVWTDDGGAVTEPPMTVGEIRRRTVGWTVVAGLAVPAAGMVVYAVTVFALDRRSLAKWEEEWADTAPYWTTPT
ncbi:hypothetical protein [Streptomyces nanshensis]|uniref:Proline rich protein membrane protein n=1 Tax=Streptomyces nanshensis TaxID=518642 RepID=A0A1E7L9K1_9ACTN|nr:hypothetical protein [Streptomyces nanshensis]OEV12922.1 hypothetical protein AN218_05935 [Streptomyces nanshensis]